MNHAAAFLPLLMSFSVSGCATPVQEGPGPSPPRKTRIDLAQQAHDYTTQKGDKITIEFTWKTDAERPTLESVISKSDKGSNHIKDELVFDHINLHAPPEAVIVENVNMNEVYLEFVNRDWFLQIYPDLTVGMY